MKIVKLLLSFFIGFASCSTVRVATDYDAKQILLLIKPLLFIKKELIKQNF